MDIDMLQRQWQAQGAQLEALVRFNKALWRRKELEEPRSSLRWWTLGTALGSAFVVLCLVWNGQFIANHFDEWRFMLPAMALHLWLIAELWTTVAQLAKARAIDYAAPVVEIQRRVEALRALSVRAFQWLFLTGVVVWFVPFLIVVARAWPGIDLYAVLGGEALFMGLAGSAVLALAILGACRLFAARLASQSTVQRLARELAGHHLTAALDRLDAIAEFEREGGVP